MTECGYSICLCFLPLWRGREHKGRGIWTPSIRFFAYELESSRISVAFKHLLMWPCSLHQTQSTGSPVLRASASLAGLCSSPSRYIILHFCVFAHFSLIEPPPSLLSSLISKLVLLINKLSFKTQLGCHFFQDVSPDLSCLPGWHFCKHFCYFLFTPLYSSLGPRLHSSLSTRTVSQWYLCLRLSPGPGRWWIHF